MHEFVAKLLVFVTASRIIYLEEVTGKYVEGEINTKDDWSFVARFCFLSEEGQFEYRIEFNEKHGYPNLLLYFDSDDQWPSVYKSKKACHEKESVLKRSQNQIVNLTVQYPLYQEISGCYPVERWNPITSTTPKRPSTTTTTMTTTATPTSTTTTITTTTETFTTFATKTTTKTNSLENVTADPFDSNIDETNTTDTPEFFNYDPNENFYVDFEKDVENINEKEDDKNDTTKVLDNPSTTERSPRRKRSILKKVFTHPSKVNKNNRIVCQNSRRFRSSRERWWFVAISNCGSNKGIHVKYKFLMTNGPPGDPWHEHFSADEFYVLPVLMAYSIAYSFLLLGVIICTIELKSRQLLHSTYKLYVLSVIFQFCGIFAKTLSYLKFAFNGYGGEGTKTFSDMMMACSETIFLLVLMLLAKGYTVTRGRLSVQSGVKITIFMCVYSITYVCLFFYQEKVFDPGQVLYLYESPAGYGLIFLRVIAWTIFVCSTIATLKHYPEKSNFYYPFNIFGTLWFVAGPAFILSANTYIDKWVRESVVNAVLLLITFGGHLMFLILTMPSRANKNFPYHVRTTQIGIMEVSGGNSPGNFNHYPYEPSSDPYEEAVIIPLTKRTEELFGGIYSHKLNSSIRSSSRQNNLTNDKEIMPDQCMENVFSWAIAKNSSALPVPSFERIHGRDRFQSSQNLEENRRESQSEFLRNDFSDYVKDVPVELFTVSKLVVTTNCANRKNDIIAE